MATMKMKGNSRREKGGDVTKEAEEEEQKGNGVGGEFYIQKLGNMMYFYSDMLFLSRDCTELYCTILDVV